MDIKLWRADFQSEDINYVLANCWPDVYAIESTHPDKPLGNNVLANPIANNDYWQAHGPFLFLEIHGFAKKVTVSSVSKPGVINKVLVAKLYDANGVQVAYNFDKGTTLVTDIGEYKAVYGIFYPGLARAIDHLAIDYQPIPPPDLSTFVDWWLCECSMQNLWCDGSDLNHDMIVDFRDYSNLFK
jgi:hypothetical protein